MRFLLFIFCLSFSYLLTAQTDNYQDLYELRSKMENGKFGERDAHIEGSPYYNDDFVKGLVLLKDSSFYEDVLLRYNAFDDELEVSFREQIFQIPSKDQMIFAVIGNDTLKSVKYLSGNRERWANFYLLASGELTLYAKRSKGFKEKEEPKGYQDAQPAKYVNKSDEYYWAKEGETLSLISNKKELITYLPEIDAKNYMKKEKLSLRKEQDLIQLVDYYNRVVK